jgi:hypothetical protein
MSPRTGLTIWIIAGVLIAIGVLTQDDSSDATTRETSRETTRVTTPIGPPSLSEQQCRDLALQFDSAAEMSDLAYARGDQEKLRSAGDQMESLLDRIEANCMSYPGFK